MVGLKSDPPLFFRFFNRSKTTFSWLAHGFIGIIYKSYIASKNVRP